MPPSSPPGLARRIIMHPVVLLIIGMALQLGAVIAVGAGGAMLVSRVGGSPALMAGFNILIALVSIVALWLLVHFVERRPLTELSLPGSASEWGMGAGVGAGAMVLTIGVIALLGGYRIAGTHGAGVLIAIAGITIQSGFAEEIVFRGIIFRLIEKWLGSWAALAISAGLFGAAHLANPNATLLSAFAIALEAGIMLGAVYMVTRRLWAAIGLHMAWNFTQGGIFGVAISGFGAKGLLDPVMSGPALLTGGSFGAEASLPAMILCTAIGLVFLVRAWRSGAFVAPSWRRFKTGEAEPDVDVAFAFA